MVSISRRLRSRFSPLALTVTLLAVLSTSPALADQSGDARAGSNRVSDLLMSLVIGTGEDPEAAIQWLDAEWDPAFVPMIMDTLYLTRDPRAALSLIKLMSDKTGQSLGFELQRWYEWMWNQPALIHPQQAAHKARLYALIDPKFEGYFKTTPEPLIRLDEVVWGGVRQDGIPPLRAPSMIAANEATYLDDKDIVFGIELNGDARAYPKRILAWHEMFTDDVGGVAVAGVYCTLCGAVILYKTDFNGERHQLGTSGFLYRSNKLMYDRASQSLWSTMRGEPVIGALVGRGIKLERGAVVTSHWGEWRRRHPHTKVLSLDTGHQRDYSEGAAYREYFATDELMFNVPKRDTRLANKDEVLALLLPVQSGRPLALAARFLANNPLYPLERGGARWVVVTDSSGANRVFEGGDVDFTAFDADRTLTDSTSMRWTMSESELTAEDGRTLSRIPAHRAFWFGWFAAFPTTELVH